MAWLDILSDGHSVLSLRKATTASPATARASVSSGVTVNEKAARPRSWSSCVQVTSARIRVPMWTGALSEIEWLHRDTAGCHEFGERGLDVGAETSRPWAAGRPNRVNCAYWASSWIGLWSPHSSAYAATTRSSISALAVASHPDAQVGEAAHAGARRVGGSGSHRTSSTVGSAVAAHGPRSATIRVISRAVWSTSSARFPLSSSGVIRKIGPPTHTAAIAFPAGSSTGAATRRIQLALLEVDREAALPRGPNRGEQAFGITDRVARARHEVEVVDQTLGHARWQERRMIFPWLVACIGTRMPGAPYICTE